MQISPLLPQVTPFNNFTSTQKFVSEYYHSENFELDINYSDQNNSVDLSLSASVTYIETIYNEQGFMVNQPYNNFDEPVVNSQSIINTDTILSEVESKFNEVWMKYLELIKERVEYLLNQITEERNRILNLSKTDSNINVADLLDFSPEKTAERIINFALSFYDGGDRQKFAAMVKKAVMKGFNEAMIALGGFLPQESYETINIVNEALENFADSGEINFSA